MNSERVTIGNRVRPGAWHRFPQTHVTFWLRIYTKYLKYTKKLLKSKIRKQYGRRFARMVKPVAFVYLKRPDGRGIN